MHATNELTGGQVAAAIGILVFLALTVPLLGMVMIPVTAVGAAARALAPASGS